MGGGGRGWPQCPVLAVVCFPNGIESEYEYLKYGTLEKM